MTPLNAIYFDGRHSTRHPVTVMVSGGRMHVVGRDVSEDFDARRVRRSLRIADTPRWLYLPGGGVCVTADNDAVDRITKDRRYEALLHKWESHPAYAAIAVLLVVAAAWFLIDKALPFGARIVAERIPVQTEATMGRQTMAGFEKYLLKASKLNPARQAALRAKFGRLVRAAGESTPYSLEFRSSPAIGPNAFALPSGIIVVTDELVIIAKSDREVLGVLAHELGHVRYRHTMRRLLESSVTALVVAGVTGDITSAASLAAAAPTVLLQAKYSRDDETEADSYAIGMLRKSGIDPRHLSDLLERLEAATEQRGGMPQFLSSHPASEQRLALAAQAAMVNEPPDPEETAGMGALPDRPKLNPTDPVQARVMALLELKDYEALETLFGDYQQGFERNAVTPQALENAYAVLRYVRRGSDAALDEWVRRYPKSHAARVARASFLYWQGWDARGGRFAADTPAERMSEAQMYFNRAKTDLERSLKLAARPYMGHLLLMSVARTAGGRSTELAHYKEAVKLAPDSVTARLLHMRILEPRWGGSYREMEEYLAETRQQLKQPEGVARVAARIPEYHALESRLKGDFRQALQYYDEAAALYAGSAVLCERARVLSRLDRYDEALRDIKDALAKARDDLSCMDLAVTLAARITDNDEAIALLTLVIEADLNSSKALIHRAGRYYNQPGKKDLALQDFRAAAGLGDVNGIIQVGSFYWTGQGGVEADREEAMFWFRKAAATGNPQGKEALARMLKLYEKKE